MTDAERTSAQAEEQAQATESGGLLGTVVERARNVAGAMTETARDVVETVTERTPEAISSAAAVAAGTVGAVVDKVRDLGGDAPEGQAVTAAVQEGGGEMPETRPLAVSEAIASQADAAPAAGADSPTPSVADRAASAAEGIATAVQRRVARVYGAVSEAGQPAVEGIATAVQRRVARVYGAVSGAGQPAAPPAEQAAPPAQPGAPAAQPAAQAGAPAPEAGATYEPAAEGGAKSGRPRRFKDVQPGMQLQGKVTSIALYGIFVDIGVGRDGLVHISEMSDKRIDSPTDLVEIGQPVDVWVKSVDPDARRISLTMRDPNRAKPERPERRGPRRREINRERLAELKVGDTVEGVISSLAPFGAFVDLGVGKDGLVHISELAEGRVERPEESVQVGERYTFKILELDPEGNRISLSLRRAQRAQRMQQLEPGTIMDGTISGIAPFGAFVDVGVGRDGLVHISELSAERVNSVEEAVKVGDKVRVKIIEVDPNSKRISLTMRVDEPLPNERERPAPRMISTPGVSGEAAPSFNPAPSFNRTPAYTPPTFEEGGGGARRGGPRGGGPRESGRDEPRFEAPRGEGRAGEGRASARRERGDRGGGRPGGRAEGGRRRREGEVFEPNEEVYTFGDTEEETFTGDATLEDLLSKFNSHRDRDRRQSREDDEGEDKDRRAAIRRTLAWRDEE